MFLAVKKDNLELDHIDPSIKSFNISKALSSWSIKKIEAEFVKLQLLCKECHIQKTIIDLKNKFGKNFFTEEEIELLIESAVKELKVLQGEVTAPVVTNNVVPTPIPAPTNTTSEKCNKQCNCKNK